MKPLNRFGGAIMIGTYQPNNRKKVKHGFARKGSKF